MDNSINKFKLEEVVPREVYEERGAKSIELLDPRTFPTLNTVRNLLGRPITINDWLWGGAFNASGLRIGEQYSDYSQHNFGRAYDLKFTGLTVKEATKILIENHNLVSAIGFIEIDQTWLHIDFRKNRCGSPLVLWSPTRGYVTIEQYLQE